MFETKLTICSACKRSTRGAHLPLARATKALGSAEGWLTRLGYGVFQGCSSLTSAANSAGFDTVTLYLRDRYKCITLRKLFLRLLGKYNQAVNEANGTEAEKHASALVLFPILVLFPTDNSSTLDVGLFLQTMSASGGNGVQGLVGYILKFV